jgi:hypothetical protein
MITPRVSANWRSRNVIRIFPPPLLSRRVFFTSSHARFTQNSWPESSGQFNRRRRIAAPHGSYRSWRNRFCVAPTNVQPTVCSRNHRSVATGLSIGAGWPLEDSKQISVLLALPSAHPADLAAFVKHVSTPGDPLYHQYLTPQQFADRFGGIEADYTALKNWATANGLVVSQESVGRINLTLRGNVSRIQKIFRTQLNTYRTSSGVRQLRR